MPGLHIFYRFWVIKRKTKEGVKLPPPPLPPPPTHTPRLGLILYFNFWRLSPSVKLFITSNLTLHAV